MKTILKSLLFGLVAFSLVYCGSTGTGSSSNTQVDEDFGGESTIPVTLHGTFRFIKDSTGKTPNKDAVITIRFRQNGTFTFKAEMPGETLTDQGTYSVDGNVLNISFDELDQAKKSGIFSIDKEGIATLPFMIFSDDDGCSEWEYVPDFPEEMPDIEKIVRQAIAEAESNFDCIPFDILATRYSISENCGLAEAYYTYSTICYFANKKWETLYTAAKAALESKFNPLYINNLCAVLLELNQLTNAKALADYCIQHSSGFSSSWGNLAYIYYQVDHLVKAEAAIDSALYYEPAAGIFHYIKAKIEEEQGKTIDADASYGQAWENGYAGAGREGAKPAGQRAKKPANNNKEKEKEKEEGVEKWAGRYQAKYISAASGETAGEAFTQFGTGMATTTVGLQTLACVQDFVMTINKYGGISGSGEIMYVYNGSSSGLASSALGAMTGGAGARLKDGSQTRKWSFSGDVDKDGNVTLNGLPSEKLDLYNVGKWEKIDTWSPLLPDAPGAAMRGPFHLKMVMTGGDVPVISYDQYLALNDKLIKQVHYRAFILRSSDDIKPECRGFAKPEEEKCPATEYIKTQFEYKPGKNLKISRTDTYTPDGGHKTETETSAEESLNSNVKVNVSANQDGNVGCSIEVEGIGLGQTGLGLEGSVGLSGSGELSGSIGVGLNLSGMDKIWEGMTGKPGASFPIKPKMSLRLIYDPKCGFGVQGSVGGEASMGDTSGSATATGVIFFNKGL